MAELAATCLELQQETHMCGGAVTFDDREMPVNWECKQMPFILPAGDTECQKRHAHPHGVTSLGGPHHQENLESICETSDDAPHDHLSDD